MKTRQNKTKKNLCILNIVEESALSLHHGGSGNKGSGHRLASKCHYCWAILLAQVIYFWVRKVCFSKNLKENVVIKNEWVKSERPQAEVWVKCQRKNNTDNQTDNVLSVQSEGPLCHHWHSIFINADEELCEAEGLAACSFPKAQPETAR